MRRGLSDMCLIAAILAPSISQAQANCAQRDVVVQRLSADYGEGFQGGGLQSGTRIFEVWHSDDDGTWTILMTRAAGTTCVMASGTNWRQPLPSEKLPAGVPG